MRIRAIAHADDRASLQSILSQLLAITRAAKQGNFTNHELAALNYLHAHLETIFSELIAPERPAPLTPKERQLVHLLHAGLSNKEIAMRLHKSVRTVKTQLTFIYRKYNVRSRTRLLAVMMGAAADAAAGLPGRGPYLR